MILTLLDATPRPVLTLRDEETGAISVVDASPRPSVLQVSPAKGEPGADGLPAYTLTTASYVQPAVSASVTAEVESSAWVTPGAPVRSVAGVYTATATDATHVSLVLVQALATSPGGTVASGVLLAPAGLAGADGDVGDPGPPGADGIPGSVAVDLVAESALTLSGEQTIDGVLTSVSRVLYAPTGTAAGIYVTGPGPWTRATDYDSATEIARGRTIYVASGQLRANTLWTLTTAGTIVVGTTSLTFTRLSRAISLAFTVSLSGAVGTTTTTLVTLPATVILTRVLERLTQALVGGGATSTVTLGTSAGGVELLLGWAITPATALNLTWGQNPAEVGADLLNALGYEAYYTTEKTISVRVTRTGATSSAGTVTITILGYEPA